MQRVCTIAVFALISSGFVFPCASASLLFADDDPVTLTITAPMRDLIRSRRQKDDFAAVMQFTDAAGSTRELSIELAARGNSRLDACDFPPLRVTIDPQQAEATLFEGQRELKMVTTCTVRRAAANWVLQEYGIYRAYNVITDFSFRVRLLNVTFRDTEAKKWERVQTAFFIESTDEAGERLRRRELQPPRIDTTQLNKSETAHNVLFQFLIGNTDFAVKRGPSGEGCCHNGRVFAATGSEHDWIVLPYDFDQAGLIATDYALPDGRLGIGRVKDRLYRGFCWHNDELTESLQRFNTRRDEIVAALLPDDLSKSTKKRASRFIDGFFRIINDAEKLQREIYADCRGPDSLEVRKTTVKQD